jgi:hypothetical protein
MTACRVVAAAVTGKQVAILYHDLFLNTATFSPDGARIITTSDDPSPSSFVQIVQVWDSATGALIAVFRGRGAGLAFAAFSDHIIRGVSDLDGQSARLWKSGPLPKGNVFQIACSLLPDHDLTSLARDYGLTALEPICEADSPLLERRN